MLTVSVVQAPHTFKSGPVISDILLQKGGEHSDCMMQVIVHHVGFVEDAASQSLPCPQDVTSNLSEVLEPRINQMHQNDVLKTFGAEAHVLTGFLLFSQAGQGAEGAAVRLPRCHFWGVRH